MQIQYTKNLDPGRFELGTILSCEKKKMETIATKQRIVLKLFGGVPVLKFLQFF